MLAVDNVNKGTIVAPRGPSIMEQAVTEPEESKASPPTLPSPAKGDPLSALDDMINEGADQ